MLAARVANASDGYSAGMAAGAAAGTAELNRHLADFVSLQREATEATQRTQEAMEENMPLAEVRPRHREPHPHLTRAL